jgi:Uma2 family endonuclease
MNAATDIRMDKATFYKWLERQEGRYELAGGRATMMTGASNGHNKIVSNIFRHLSLQLDRLNWSVFVADFAVEIGDQVRYPDVLVFPAMTDQKARHAENPALIIEVLSASSVYVDMNEKAAEYTSLPSLAAYVVFSQDAALSWNWTRGAESMPTKPTLLEGLDAIIEVPALAAKLSHAEVFFGLTLDG